MNAKYVIPLLLLCLSSAIADEIHLKEGKILTGKITQETDEEYTIRLGKGMVLRVLKEKATKVVRSEPAVPVAVSTTSTYLTKPRPSAPSGSSRAVASTAAGVSAPVALSNPNAEAITAQRDHKGFKIIEHTATKVYTVTGVTIGDIKNDIADRETGKGIKTDRRREASDAVWTVTWTGDAGTEEGKHMWKSGVVFSTVTVTLPSWKPTGKPSNETVQSWNEFFGSISSFEAGRSKIYRDALDSFTERLSNLRSDSESNLHNESNVLFKEMKTRVSNRVQGYLRRSQNKK